MRFLRGMYSVGVGGVAVLLAVSMSACDSGDQSVADDLADDVADVVSVDDVLADAGPDSASVDTVGDGVLPDSGDVGDLAEVFVDAEVVEDMVVGPMWPSADPIEVPEDLVTAYPTVFSRMSMYSTVAGEWAPGDCLAQDCPDSTTRPNVAHRGAFGIGNGRVFGFVGLVDPVNTLHTLVGPTYEKHSRFFGDYEIVLEAEGKVVASQAGVVARSLTAPAVFTREKLANGLDLETVDLVPWTDDPSAGKCFFRMVRLNNRADTTSEPATLVVFGANYPEPDGASLIETTDDRVLVTRFSDGAGEAVKGRLTRAVGAIEPRESQTVVLLHCTENGDSVPPNFEFDLPELIETTAERYGAWEDKLVDVLAPDPVVVDFIDGMKMTLKVQTAQTGATCPMSEYTRTWARDNIGPVLAMLSYGAFADVADMLDYVYGAIVLGGDLSNSYDADLDLSNLPAPPDWSAMGKLSSRVAAETPSYMVRMYGEYSRYSGEFNRVQDRWGLIRRCQLAQAVSDEGFLPFTGDETFRAAMNAVFGLFLEYAHHEDSWSANSSLLWLGASRDFEAMAGQLGEIDDVSAMQTLRQKISEAFMAEMVLNDGCIAAYLDKATMTASGAFEDVSLNTTWAGWLDGDDDLAQDSLECLLEGRWRETGDLVSPLDPVYQGTFDGVWDGIYTGMAPGYALSGLTSTGHPYAEAAFNAVGGTVTTSGNLQEYMVLDDHSGLSLLYDPNGSVGDYTAKFRPWEGGIVVEAVLEYLFGFDPDATARTFKIRPHLPNGWPWLKVNNLRAGDARFDLSIERLEDGALSVAVTSRATDTWQVSARFDWVSAPEVTLDGVAIAEDELIRFEYLGNYSAELSASEMTVGQTITFVVR